MAVRGRGGARQAGTPLPFITTLADYYGDAPYKGILFVLNALGALVAAYGIWRGERWGWMLGAIVAGGAFVMYVISRIFGLPGLPPDTWAEPIGIVSLIAEAGFVITAINVLAQARRDATETAGR